MTAAQAQRPQHSRRRPPPPPRRSTACSSSSMRGGALYLAAVLLVALVAPAAAVLPSHRPGNVLTLILTDCAKYQDWQTIAAAFAWRQSDQPGSVVRVANCNEKDTAGYDKRMLDYVQTHMAKQYAWYEPLHDWYAAYNKPGAVVDYFEHNSPSEEWVVVLDSDMLLKKAFRPEELPLERGWAYAAHYDYLVGVDNALALRHVPEVAPRNDTFAGNKGRRGDRVGGPYFMHRDDLRSVAPRWLNYTHIMRDDMEAYQDSGDTASKKGDRIWIAEMYGYAFGAAKSDVWHKWKHDFMLYPSYTPSAIPHVMHYGLIYRVGDWQYDKHWYFDFDVHACPPWPQASPGSKPKAGIFPPPPYPHQLPNKDTLTQYRDLLSVSVISVVNAAMCDYHVRNCPPSSQLTEVCDEAFKLYHAIDTQIKDYEWRWGCADHNKECEAWAKRGECAKSKQYMMDHCRASCKYCTPPGERPKSPAELKPLSVAAISAEIGVTPVPAGSSGGSSPGASPAAAAVVDAVAAAAAEQRKRVAEEAAAAKPAAAAAEQAAAGSGAKAATPAAAAAAGAGLTEANMRARFASSTIGYAALVKRCADLQGVDDAGLKDCLKAASLKLLYPGTLKPGSTAVAAAAADAGSGQQQQQAGKKQQQGGAQDLASLHAQFHGGGGSRGGSGSVENMLSRSLVASGGWGFAEQALVVLMLLGVGAFGYSRWQQWRQSRAKTHSRSE